MDPKKKYQKMWEANALGVLAGETVAYNFSNLNKLKGKAGVNEKNIIFFSKKGLGTQFFNNVDELRTSAEIGFKRFRDKNELNKYLEECKENLILAERVYGESITMNLSELTNKDLLELFKKYLEYYQIVYTYYHACQPQYFSNIEDYVKSQLKLDLEQSRADEVYANLTLSEEIDPIGAEELEWLTVLQKIKRFFPNKDNFSFEELKKNKKVEELIEEHSKKYVYLGTVETFAPWDNEYYMNLLIKQIGLDANKLIADIKQKKVDLGNKKREIIKKYQIKEEIAITCDNLAKIGVNRLALRFAWSKVSHVYIMIATELANRNIDPSLNNSLIWEYRLAELEDAILKKKYLSLEEINKRKDSFIFYVKNGEIDFLSGQEAIKLKEELIGSESLENIKEIRGQVACKGKVIGRVKKFSWTEENLAKEMENMNDKDILVAGQTRPFLMPAIKKASAIVTDEGGITSHAAIVSRELGIPAVIGTRIATEVLHDGDLIEVDADKGVVTIIEKAK